MIRTTADMASFTGNHAIPDHNRTYRRIGTRMTSASRRKRKRTLHEGDF